MELKYEKEIERLLEEHYRDDWMDDDDWKAYKMTLSENVQEKMTLLNDHITEWVESGKTVDNFMEIMIHTIREIQKL